MFAHRWLCLIFGHPKASQHSIFRALQKSPPGIVVQRARCSALGAAHFFVTCLASESIASAARRVGLSELQVAEYYNMSESPRAADTEEQATSNSAAEAQQSPDENEPQDMSLREDPGEHQDFEVKEQDRWLPIANGTCVTCLIYLSFPWTRRLPMLLFVRLCATTCMLTNTVSGVAFPSTYTAQSRVPNCPLSNQSCSCQP